ncbi:MAG: rRNA maturation RNase YbeY [Candidatus Melainabacteria bacterium RIFOXYA12_FULL_32_12]|nr:MAG: rRNA maturation RNase YbeY [Candidatus Melainabacteria bacterium RIFOXYA2_FULL_32_9]OGI28968.1 MAG: rRNA maturation RNase YbeY [Candidatus Melainabacteria bacterium RIFOXYA12_FULL_32_12]
MDKYCITLTNEQDEILINEAELEKISCNMLDYLVKNPKITAHSKLNTYNLNDYNLCIDILICDDSKIREINRDYREKDNATDVISFALFADSPETRIILDNQIFLGEIIISAQTAKIQSEEEGKTLREEFFFLLSHGILHLFGFDHPDEESLESMLNIQNELISNI